MKRIRTQLISWNVDTEELATEWPAIELARVVEAILRPYLPPSERPKLQEAKPEIDVRNDAELDSFLSLLHQHNKELDALIAKFAGFISKNLSIDDIL